MKHYSGRILETQLDSYKKSIYKCRLEAEIFWQPGQYFNAESAADKQNLIPLTLFPLNFIPENSKTTHIDFISYEDIDWQPGQEFLLRGPLGKTWYPEPFSKRLAMLNLSPNLRFIEPLIRHCLQQKMELSLLTNHPATSLPPSVEVLPLSELPEMRGWADEILMDISRIDFPNLESLCGVGIDSLPRNTSVLVLDHFPCGGKADCGICAFSGGKQTIYPCKEGPVLKLRDLIK